MSKAHIHRTMAKKEQREEKAEEKAYVRQEKAADEAMARKLQEAYGTGPRVREDGKLSRAWRCKECGFHNYESRMACANCLAVQPRTDRDGKVIAAPTSVAGRPQTRDNTVTLTRVGERYYRAYVSHQIGMKKALAQGAVKQLAYGDAGDDGDDGEECDETGMVVCGAAGGSAPSTAAVAGCTEDMGGSSGADPAVRLGYDDDRRLFVLRMLCQRRYHRFVVGSGARTLKDIERTTNVKVVIPKSLQRGGDAGDDDTDALEGEATELDAARVDPELDYVTIEGQTAAAVRAAQLRIDSIMAEARDKVDYTHFLSIPLGPIPSAKAAFTSLIDDMKATVINEDHNIDASIFQKPVRVHITLLMLRLYSKADLDTARLILESLEPELQSIFGPNDSVALKGLASMNPDVRAAHVVYMEVLRDDVYRRLQTLVSKINQSFVDAGIATTRDIQENGKLHATIMNSKWRKGRAHQAFDASQVIRLFGQKPFGAHHLRSIEINVLGGGAAPDGYFTSAASIGFP